MPSLRTESNARRKQDIAVQRRIKIQADRKAAALVHSWSASGFGGDDNDGDYDEEEGRETENGGKLREPAAGGVRQDSGRAGFRPKATLGDAPVHGKPRVPASGGQQSQGMAPAVLVMERAHAGHVSGSRDREADEHDCWEEGWIGPAGPHDSEICAELPGQAPPSSVSVPTPMLHHHVIM